LKALLLLDFRRQIMFRTFLTRKATILILSAALMGCSAEAKDAVVVVDARAATQAPQSTAQEEKESPQPSQEDEGQKVCEGQGETGAMLGGLANGKHQVQPGPGAEALWVRSNASLDGSIIGCLERGAAVGIARVEGDWALVQFAGGEGWAWAEMVK
jgi:uncharacterized protein YgiM (DUF1202 family)